MSLPPQVAWTAATDRQGQHDSALRGFWLLLARTLWIALFILALIVFYASLFAGHYDFLTTLFLIINSSGWFGVSLILFWRRSADRTILPISLLLALTSCFFIPRYPGVLVNSGIWWVPVDLMALAAGIMLIFLYTFPDGRFVPRFTRWLALGWVAVSLVPVPFFAAASPWTWWLSPLYTLGRSVFYFSLTLAMLYRYRRTSTHLQRQQIKWVVFAAIIVGTEVSIAGLMSLLPVSSPLNLLHMLIRPVTYILPVLFPLSIGIALLRYRLWDIDNIINRTLVYSLLTGLLALIYFSLVIASQFLFRLLSGQELLSSPIIVISTLVIAGLFQPLRRRLQALIDRRFYRGKYNAEQTLAAFSVTLRSEVELHQLSKRIISTIEETMQPGFVSLWLRAPVSSGHVEQQKRDLEQPPE